MIKLNLKNVYVLSWLLIGSWWICLLYVVKMVLYSVGVYMGVVGLFIFVGGVLFLIILIFIFSGELFMCGIW